MISFELAKQLKDNGFPQNLDDKYGFYYLFKTTGLLSYQEYQKLITHKTVSGDALKFAKEILCKAPSLSELIEACGDEFESLTHWGDKWLADSKGQLRNDMVDEEYPEAIRCESGCCGKSANGSTPEEAVANLYLEINKK